MKGRIIDTTKRLRDERAMLLQAVQTIKNTNARLWDEVKDFTVSSERAQAIERKMRLNNSEVKRNENRIKKIEKELGII